jgi:hypothetical protein
MHTQADALFLRPPDFFAPDDPQLAKLAFAAHVFGQHAIGFAAMDRFVPAPIDGDEPVYRRFLRDLDAARTAVPALYPPTFSETYTDFETSAMRFDATRGEELARRLNRTTDPIRTRLLARQSELVELARAPSTRVEDTFRGYRLTEHADRLGERRRTDLAAVLSALGLRLA